MFYKIYFIERKIYSIFYYKIKNIFLYFVKNLNFLKYKLKDNLYFKYKNIFFILYIIFYSIDTLHFVCLSIEGHYLASFMFCS